MFSQPTFLPFTPFSNAMLNSILWPTMVDQTNTRRELPVRALRSDAAGPLPFELISNIGEILHDSDHSISSCLLVCRMWRNACRRYLYRSITIHSHGRLEELVSRLEEDTDLWRFVADLRVDVSRLVSRSFPNTPDLSWISAITAKLPRSLQLTRNLHLCNLLSKINSDGVFRNFASFSTLESLNICNRTIEIMELNELVNSLPRLKALHLEDLRMPYLSYSMTSNSNLSLETLELVGVYSITCHNILNWLKNTNTMQTLRSLSMQISSFDLAEALGHFLKSLGPVVMHLNLRFFIPGNQDAFRYRGASIKLYQSPLSSLLFTTLEMHSCVDYSHSRQLQSAVLYLNDLQEPLIFLERLICTGIRKIIINHWKPHLSVKEVDFGQIDKYLSEDNFARLQDVVIMCSRLAELEQEKEEIRRLFPLLAVKGLLRAEASDDIQ